MITFIDENTQNNVTKILNS